jgi:hypothetical protein
MNRLALIALCLSVPASARADDCNYSIGGDPGTRGVAVLTDDTVLIRTRYIYVNKKLPPQLFTIDRTGKVTAVKGQPKPERDATLELARDGTGTGVGTGKASLCRAGSCASVAFPVNEGKYVLDGTDGWTDPQGRTMLVRYEDPTRPGVNGPKLFASYDPGGKRFATWPSVKGCDSEGPAAIVGDHVLSYCLSDRFEITGKGTRPLLIRELRTGKQVARLEGVFREVTAVDDKRFATDDSLYDISTPSKPKRVWKWTNDLHLTVGTVVPFAGGIAVVGQVSGTSQIDAAVLDAANGNLLHRIKIPLCK